MNTLFFRLLAAASLVAAFNVNAQVVVIANPAAEALTKEQIGDIFLGRNKAFTPINQPEGAALRDEFYQKATGRDASQVKATWARLVFTGKATLPREVPDSASVKKLVASDPKAIGYVEKSAAGSDVKVVLTLD